MNNKMTAEDFEIYKQYILSISPRPELLGASSHILDILKKQKETEAIIKKYI